MNEKFNFTICFKSLIIMFYSIFEIFIVAEEQRLLVGIAYSKLNAVYVYVCNGTMEFKRNSILNVNNEETSAILANKGLSNTG